jgi:O-acetyl-ADP-ribose deacetylase (regulator of RNase III)
VSSDFNVRIGLVQLQLLRADITCVKVDAIVNAANSELAGGGGVDGAIHEAGGVEIMRELDSIRSRIGRCEPGDAVVTSAGSLPAKFVFHTVGPRYRDGRSGEPDALARCYQTCLNLAVEHGARTISFPSISTGVYGYPLEDAAALALRTVAGWLHEHNDAVHVVKLIQFSDHDHQIYRKCAENLHGSLTAATHG